MQVPLVGPQPKPQPADGSMVSSLQEQQLQEQLFLERLTLRLQQMGPPSSSTQQDCIRKLKSLNLDDHFWMYIFKVAPCTRTYAHKWTLCPCAHAGETARRRDPRTSSYKAVLCPLVKAKKVCPLGDSCSYSHNVFEHWLHPSRYKTRLCSFGSSCNRSICFFAHTTDELRCVPNMDENKEVDEREFLMQLMVAQESGLLPQDALNQQPPSPAPQQVQLPHQHSHPLPSQQLPVLYTMAPDALQQPVQQVLTRTSTTGSAGNVATPALRRPGPARSLTGIPSSYTLPTNNMPQLHGQQPAAYCTPAPPPARLHPHSFNGSFSSAPNATVGPVEDSRYLSMASLQETLAGLGLGPGGTLSGGADEDAASCDDMFAVGDGASMVHGFHSVPRPQRPGGSSFFARAMGQRISDPGMHALFSSASGGGGASSDEESSENLSTMNRISDSGKPLGFVLPLMNYAQQQQATAHAQQTLQEQLAAVQQQVSANVGGGGGAASAPTLVQTGAPSATFPIMRHHRGSSNSPHSSSVTSGSPRSSSPPTSWDTNCSASQIHFQQHMAPHSPQSAPAAGMSVQPQQPQPQQPELLQRPQPRVLEPSMPKPLSPDAPRRVRDTIQLVEEDDGDTYKEEDEDKGKGKGKKGKGKGKKVTAEMKRAARKMREAEREEKAQQQKREREEIFEVGEEGMSLMQLAEMIQEDPSDIVRTLFMKGIMLSMNQVLDKNTCKLVASEYDLLMVDKEEDKSAKKRSDFLSEEDIDNLVPRPPVVTVMGHVDHGKTSLLDYIRKSRVAAKEAGGITQGIGAYNTTVEVDGEQRMVCFLDTPGHEAFSAMRARGAQVTDIAVIIVAADDGIRPQTREAVAHAQAAEVPIIVAINKIDKPGADPERVKQELLELNLVPEEWGGNTAMVLVSAKKGEGVADLLQIISWTAEERALVCNPLNRAQGTVIEAHLDRKIGSVATLLVQAGTLRVGDVINAGGAFGKIRVLKDDLGNNLESAGASVPVQVLGLNQTPMAGELWSAAANESEAREAAEQAMEKVRAQRFTEMTGGGSMVTLSSLATVDEDTEAMQKLNLVIKGDSVGVVEAIKASLSALPQQSITLRYLLSGSGDITLSDIDLAAASQGLIVGFNLELNDAVETHAKRLGVTVKTYKVIYDLIDDVKAAMEGKLRTVEEKLPVGEAEVKAVFGARKSKVAGCLVTQGKLMRALVSVRRGKQVVHEGPVSSLRRVKDDVNEVSEGVECGLGAEGFSDWREGDVIECYTMVSKSRRLEEAQAATAVDPAALGA